MSEHWLSRDPLPLASARVTHLLKCPVLPRMVVSPLNGGGRLSPWFGSSDIPCWDNWKLAWCGRAELKHLEMLMGVWGMWMSWRATYLHIWDVWRCPSGQTIPPSVLTMSPLALLRPAPTKVQEAQGGWSLILLFFPCFWLLLKTVHFILYCFSELFVTSQFLLSLNPTVFINSLAPMCLRLQCSHFFLPGRMCCHPPLSSKTQG